MMESSPENLLKAEVHHTVSLLIIKYFYKQIFKKGYDTEHHGENYF